MLFYRKGLQSLKNYFPLLLALGKLRFYVYKFGQHTKVAL